MPGGSLVDAVVDALSVRLRRVPKDERDALRPTDLYALVRLFPVLDEIWERPPPLVLASDEARRLGAVTLRKLLRQFGRRCPLVVHIDDFQWADRDSVELLDVLTRPPDDPAMLLVVSYRREEADAEAVRALLEHDVLAGERSRRIELGPLSAADARALAHTLLCAEAPETRRVHAESIALRSRGSPFYIAQMALEGAQPDTVESDLDAIVARRLTELPEPALRLLTVVAVFGGPLPVALARDLAAASDDVVGLLCAQGLLMRGETSVDESAHIETAHDRVREVVLTRAEPAERIRLHQSIGELLLAHHDGDPPADAIFMVVNHLDAGLRDFAVTPVTFEGDPPADWEVDVPGRGTDAVATSPERQLQLARLNQRAGQRALEAGAWVSARRYFDFAWDLCRSWRAQARRGQGHYALCVAVAFGRAQATFSFDIARADGWVRELLGWSLSMDDYCRVAQWYCASLSMEGRTLESVQFGVEALVHIGFPIPARPSWLRAIVSYVRGWRALWRLGIQRLRTSEPITDLRIRTAMDIAAVTGGWAFAHDLRLHCTLTGFHARLLSRHGFHDWAPAALLGWAASALFVGRLGKARDLLALIREFVETRPLSAAASCGTQAMMLSILPMFSPIDEVVAQCEPAYRRAREIAPPRLAELAGMLCANTHYLQSTPLRRFDEFLCEVERDWNGLEIPWTRDSLIGYRRYFRALEHGDLEPEIAEGLESLKDNANLTASLRVFQIEVQLLLGHITPAWEGVLEVSRRYRRALGPSWISPLFSLIGVLVAAERWQGDKPPRRVWRMCRRFRASAARWVKRCPQNFAPMVDIIDGELLGLEGRHEAAALALERARATAAEHGMHRVVGLASERLAKLTRRRGHALLAEGAFDAAHEAYEAWGATAVVLRLDRERVASPG